MDQTKPAVNPKKPMPSVNTSSNAASSSKQANSNQCPNCNKIFAADRIQKHLDVCRPRGARPKFDAGKHRTQGTQAEKYYKRREGV